MIGLEIKNVSKNFGDVPALEDVTLSVEDSELFFLLGPSGCGKTTLLRIIAGFYTPDSGAVLFHGEDLLNKPPEKRNIGMVFQNYSLWPHMTVAENVAYGLKMRKKDQNEIDRRVAAALEMVSMEVFASRKPAALSGGEQQRIALARALVYEPEIVLLDEPLSNLDAKLRRDMRNEIRRLHETLGITMVYVTHDQEEAASMADRIALFRKGSPVQIDTPERLYAFPSTQYAAEFFGNVNCIKGTVSEVMEHAVTISGGGIELTAAVPAERRINFPVGASVVMVIRPEQVEVNPDEAEENIFEGEVLQREFLGNLEKYSVRSGETAVTLTSMNDPDGKPFEKGDRLRLHVHRNRIHLLGGRK